MTMKLKNFILKQDLNKKDLDNILKQRGSLKKNFYHQITLYLKSFKICPTKL